MIAARELLISLTARTQTQNMLAGRPWRVFEPSKPTPTTPREPLVLPANGRHMPSACYISSSTSGGHFTYGFT
jgi:hypothetical protein